MQNLPVIHLDRTGSGGGGVSALWKYTATNYADLLTKTGMVEGDLAIVYNSQGVWLVNRKLKGVYIYQSGVWEYANQELQNQLELSQYKVKIDSTDDTGGFLEDKNLQSVDFFRFKTFNPNKTQSLNLRDNIKPVFMSRDPLVTDDNTVLDGITPTQPNYRIGQVWVNTVNDSFFICADLSTGAAVWKPLQVSNGVIVWDQVATAGPLTANTDDLSITDLATSNVIYISTDGANYDLTGIDSTGISDGQTFFLYNVGGSGDVKFKNNNAGSLAANRFIANGDVNVKDGMGTIITYDATASRWRLNYYK